MSKMHRGATVKAQRGKQTPTAFVGVYVPLEVKRRMIAAAQFRNVTLSDLVRDLAAGLEIQSSRGVEMKEG